MVSFHLSEDVRHASAGKIVAHARPSEGEPGTVFFFKEDLQVAHFSIILIFLGNTRFSELNFSQVAEVFFSSSGGFLLK
jgi:hypothetical protein